ncbi:MAG: hypothetical protein GX595_16335, partial [Lentisphaerae bacterium]|nr:hypothetical protein [Lentisphaerota bacterium]
MCGMLVPAPPAAAGLTGLRRQVSYSDTTPSVSYTYDRLGRPVTVVDAAGTRTFAYNDGATGT